MAKTGGDSGPKAVPSHIANLSQVGCLKSICGKEIPVWELSVNADDPVVSAWARHFRQSYCTDDELDLYRLDQSREDYLNEMVFPHPKTAPGPSVRAGDFAELLISDFLEYLQGYWVPRYKYQDKASPNESVKGSDVLGFRQKNAGVASLDDTLIVCEVKAQLTGKKYNDRLKTAVTDSSKDFFRVATTLNALKQRAHRSGLTDKFELVSRFQRKTDAQFILKSAAAAVLSAGVYDAKGIADVDCSIHSNANNLELLVVKGGDLMQLAHKLYEVAASEA